MSAEWAEKRAKPTIALLSHLKTKPWVPHISLVFRECGNTTELHFHLELVQELSSQAPHPDFTLRRQPRQRPLPITEQHPNLRLHRQPIGHIAKQS